MAQIRVWKVKSGGFAKQLEKILKENVGNKNLDIITDDRIFDVKVVNDDKDSPGSIDVVVSMFNAEELT